jgi:hypothetical protein
MLEPTAGPFDVDHGGVVDHAVDDGGGDHGVAEVVAELLEVDVRGHDRGAVVVSSINDFEK